jgi:hypothetical protein
MAGPAIGQADEGFGLVCVITPLVQTECREQNFVP